MLGGEKPTNYSPILMRSCLKLAKLPLSKAFAIALKPISVSSLELKFFKNQTINIKIKKYFVFGTPTRKTITCKNEVVRNEFQSIYKL